MLLVTSGDNTASIWNVPSDATWPSTPHVTLKGHSNNVRGGAFLGDESHVITASLDKSLLIWRTSDGVQTANYQCGESVRHLLVDNPYNYHFCHSPMLLVVQANSLSYHAESGNIIIGLKNGHVEMWQTAPHIALFSAPQATLPAHECVRQRLAEAQAQAFDIQASLDKADSGLRQQMSREQELKQSIADLEVKRTTCFIMFLFYDINVNAVTSEKKALAQLQTPEYIAQSRDFSKLMERHSALLGIIHVCTQTLDSLTDCLSVSGLEDLRGDSFKEWLCDIGMGKLQTALKDIDGISLTMLNVEHVMDYDVTFNDAAALQLRGYIAHYKLNDDSAFAPSRDSVLSWDDKQTANWIKSLNGQYESLSSAGWNGAALCSLSPPRVIEASKGALKAPDAVKFIGLVRAKRNETDGNKATWVTKWIGSIPIENQSP